MELIEERKAAAACREADLKFNPPRQTGREAFNQDLSDREPPVMSERADQMRPSKALAAFRILQGGQVLVKG